ncbi:hypothetical protein Oweho_0659 [Owenweeksia hongkongensis DSM 17368]|uniref:Uncharacterized protein n=1 Tax=Owenweeksia hongkongensis (strain DSM 17368 / CIP 108786 / JCM 12287 / NRRL B-23963 / UST20020801) TaxID=926562 RepID=G8R102_OWEHD|nr:hypothetical protein [Owenweeksia hongkongensis]AEV31673.1 hypothetical protein Oweho_0659 [Owenweeksia hongkongensis DSM 17368]
MKHITTILALIFTTISASAMNCEKCAIENVKLIAENLDSLTVELIKDFFCTFDKSCQNNSEYSEWSNEIVFELLDHDAKLFLTVLKAENLETKKMIIKEIETPSHEVDLNRIYKKIESTNYEGTLKKEVLEAVSIATKKNLKMESTGHESNF